MADGLVPTQVTQQQIGFAPEVAPYATKLLGQAYGLTNIQTNPFQQYMGERFAQFTPLQQQAFAGAQAMEAAPQLADASAMAGTAGLQALAYNQYQPAQFGNFYQGLGAYTPTSFTAPGVGTQTFAAPGAAQGFMSPYMQGVVDVQQREAQRQADIASTARGQKYARAGAFGGARQAIENAEAQRNLATQMGGIQAQGLQSAFQQAQQQFNAEQGARLQAQLANQQARMQAQQAAEQSRQFGYGNLMQQAGLGAQYGQAAAQLGEQSRQYGAGLGLQGLQTALQSAQQLGGLGQTQFGQNLALNQLQAQYGQQQQQRMQDVYNAQYQDFLNFQNYPYKQLGFMSDILRGVPLTQTGSQVYAQPPSTLGTLAGLGLGAYGLMKKEGGAIKGYAEGGMAYGGDVTSDDYVEGAIKRLSNDQLQVALKNALNRRDVKQAEMIQEELRERAEAASYSRGLAGAAPTNMQDMLPSEESMRRGGIVSFAEPTEDNNYSLVEEPSSPAGRFIEDIGGKFSERKEMDALRRKVEDIYRPAAGLKGLFMKQTDVERQRAKDIMANLGGYSKDELRALAAGEDVRYPVAGAGRGRSTVGMTAEDAASMSRRSVAPAPAPAAPKTTKKADAAATAVGNAMAQTTGGTPEDEIAKARKYMAFFAEQDKPLFDAMKEQIDDIKAKSKELGENKTRRALSAFGFEMARAASKVGRGRGLAGALSAAGEAAPAITASIQDTEKMQREYDRLGKQMNVAMAQAKVAASRGDKQAALSLIKTNEQIGLQRNQLEEQIRANRARERLLGQRAAAGNMGLERTMLQTKGAIAREAQRQAAKDWNNPVTGRALRQQYPSMKAYQDELFENSWSKTMPQLQYLGTLDSQSDGG